MQKVGDVGTGQHGAELRCELLRVLCDRELASGDRLAYVIGEEFDTLRNGVPIDVSFDLDGQARSDATPVIETADTL